jgi:hypothetical protein
MRFNVRSFYRTLFSLFLLFKFFQCVSFVVYSAELSRCPRSLEPYFLDKLVAIEPISSTHEEQRKEELNQLNKNVTLALEAVSKVKLRRLTDEPSERPELGRAVGAVELALERVERVAHPRDRLEKDAVPANLALGLGEGAVPRVGPDVLLVAYVRDDVVVGGHHSPESCNNKQM